MTETRRELIRLLSDLSEEAGELRFLQMIANLAMISLGTEPGAVWDAEDTDLANAAKQLIERYRERRASVA